MESSNNLREGAREIMAGLSFPVLLAVQCGAMTVIWVSTLPDNDGGMSFITMVKETILNSYQPRKK